MGSLFAKIARAAQRTLGVTDNMHALQAALTPCSVLSTPCNMVVMVTLSIIARKLFSTNSEGSE